MLSFYKLYVLIIPDSSEIDYIIIFLYKSTIAGKKDRNLINIQEFIV
ncbi:hypothetical protein ASZ90_007038 [hydrocarbon metagenome]|uniref:Uncharacterized protein n=1 Tax=hydrocarbon metagenome TaxID=938273 RepID=A0A0W8FR91_9ZZZZ